MSLGLLCLVATPTHAGTKLNIDHVDASSFLKDGTIRLYVDLLNDAGDVVEDLDGDNVKVTIDDDVIPGKVNVQTYQEAKERVAVAMLLAAHHGYIPLEQGDPNILEMEKEGFSAFVKDLDTNDKVTIYYYDNTGLNPVTDWRDSGADVADALLERVKRTAAAEEKGTTAPDFYKHVDKMLEKFDEGGDGFPRRMILLLMSDGFDRRAQRGGDKLEKKVKSISERAVDRSVKIYTVGFSLSDAPYLVHLGSLASKTNGVYRQVKDPSSIKDSIETIADQLKKQYVLDFKPTPDFDGKEKKARVRIEVVTPNGETLDDDYDLKVRIQEKPFAWRSVLTWVGVGIGGLLALLLLVKIIRAILARRPTGPEEPERYEGPYKARLAVIEGDYAGQEFFIIGEQTTIGSIPGNDIVIPGGGVSRRHAGVHVDEMRFELADFGSTSGTFVNGKRVTKTFLRDGDQLQMGEHVLKFHLK